MIDEHYVLRHEIEMTLRTIEELREHRDGLPLERGLRAPIQRELDRYIARYKALRVLYDEAEERDRERRHAEELGLAGLREAYARGEKDLEEFERLLPYVLEEKPGPRTTSQSRAELLVSEAVLIAVAVLVIVTFVGFMLAVSGVK